MAHTHTTTFAVCSIVILAYPGGEVFIYAQDYGYINADIPIPHFVGAHLDSPHIRLFRSMTAFTEWLQEVNAVVDNCSVYKVT